MSMDPTVSTKSPSRRRWIALPFARRRKILTILKDADPDSLKPIELAKELGATSVRSVERLWKKLGKEADRLMQTGAIDKTRHQTIAKLLRQTDPLTIAETLSPYYPALSKLPFYTVSDAPTRLVLRRSIARFARHHRLSPESAALLWKGEHTPPPRLAATALLLPIPICLALLLIAPSLLSTIGVILLLIPLPTVFYAAYLLSAAALRRILPSAPVPLLQSGAGHSVLTVGVGEANRFDRVLDGIARIACSGQGDSHYLLLLTLPDHVVAEAAGEEGQIALWQKKTEDLARRLDITLSLLVAPRRYDAKKKRWRGQQSQEELATLIKDYLADANLSCEAVCILPADAAILPGGGERLSAALFHPLCTADALVFLSPAGSPLPNARLTTLRQCLLQKFDTPADLVGWGIYRTEGLARLGEGQPLSPRLISQPLLAQDGNKQPPYAASQQHSPSLLPFFRHYFPLVPPILLFGMIAAKLPPSQCLLLWSAASADLLAAALLSLRVGKRFHLYTLPAWKRIGRALGLRFFLPLGEVKGLTHPKSLTELCLSTLLFGSMVIALGAPLSFMGLVWCILPILMAETPRQRSLNADEQASCHALATRLYPLLGEIGSALPPAYLTHNGERAPYTTPVAIGARLMAELSACDLGLIDVYTLERRVGTLISHMEQLPTRCGLPYARYASDSEEYYQDSHIDTMAAGIYALCLASAESGLLEYAPRHPDLYTQAQRLAHLSMQMDFTLLLREDHSLCNTLSVDGGQEGHLSYLFCGGIALFAALSSDSTVGMGGNEKSTAWQKLLSPAQLHKGRLSIASEHGLLEDYLLTALLLPSPKGSLTELGTRCAIDTLIREAKRNARTNNPLFTIFRKRAKEIGKLLLPNQISASSKEAPLSKRSSPMKSLRGGKFSLLPPLLLSTGSKHLCKSRPSEFSPITAPLLCMMIEERHRPALALLQQLQETAPFGGFADPSHPQQILIADASLGLIALAGGVTGKRFSRRLMALPRCGALYPFLCRRPDSAVEGESTIPSSAEPKTSHDAPPSVCLLGNARHGLLIAKGRGISLWEGAVPLTAPTSVNRLFAGGRMSGLLLFRDGELLPLPTEVSRRDHGQLTLSGNEMVCRIEESPCGWRLEWERALPHPIEVRFLFCPAASAPLRLSEEAVVNLEGITLLCLCIEYSATLTAVIAAEGLTDPFTHADESPFPRGRGIASLLRLTPRSACGWMSAPSCIIGGECKDSAFSIRIVCGVSKTAALSLLRSPALPLAGDLPLPVPDGGLAAKVLEWQMAALFAGAPIPAAMAVGGEGSDSAHLNRCLSGGKELLTGKGFPAAEHTPFPLTVSRRVGAEALMCRLLSDSTTEGETPLLPAMAQVREREGYPHILRGRDLPNISRTYHNTVATLYADPEGLHLRLSPSVEELRIEVYLTQSDRILLLPAAATEVTYYPEETIFSGEGFTLRMALIDRLPLLAIRLTAEGEAKISFPSLSLPSKSEGGDQFWHNSEEKVVFCRQTEKEGERIWLIGCFPKAHDQFYYWVRESVTPLSLEKRMEAQKETLRIKASLLRIEAEGVGIPNLPAVAAIVMGSDSPARALLSPLTAPAESTAHLVQLATGTPSLLLPIALLIRVAVSDDDGICHLRLPTGGGRASLYLIAARLLETAMEEDSQNPLLPPLVGAFARLAERIGDLSGLAHYTDFQPKKKSVADRTSLPEVSPQTVQLLAALYRGESGAGDALLTAINCLPPFPNPTEAALLWCGVLWGILGFIPKQEGFTLAPMAMERALCLHLSYKGDWQIRLAPGCPPICAHVGKMPSELPQTEEKILEKANISYENRCISERNGVK